MSRRARRYVLVIIEITRASENWRRWLDRRFERQQALQSEPDVKADAECVYVIEKSVLLIHVKSPEHPVSGSHFRSGAVPANPLVYMG